MNAQLRRNIQLLLILRGLRTFLFVIPVIIPFFQSNGLSQTQIFLLQSVFAGTLLLFEVPSGYFADHYGRRTSLILASWLGLAGFSVYALGMGFTCILIAEVLLGLGASFFSGADTALAYDSYLAMGKVEDYRHYESRSLKYMSLMEAGSSLLGGLIAIISLHATIVAQIPIEIVAVFLAYRLVEAPRHKPSSGHPLRNVLRVTKLSLHGHKELKWLILYAAVVGTMTHTAVWLYQLYYEAAGVPIGLYGVLWTLSVLSIAFFAGRADAFERRLGQFKALASLVFIGVMSYLVLSITASLYLLPFILGLYFVRAVLQPIIRDYLNALIESDLRATVLSVASLAKNILYVGMGPLIGVINDTYSLQAALQFSAVIYGLLGAVALWRLKAVQAKERSS